MQQGGSILIKGKGKILYEHADSGILKTADVDRLMEVIQTSKSANNEKHS